jgi:hypothetical protein
MMRWLLVVLIVLATPLLAASPEYLVGDDAATAAPHYRHSPAIASDGDGFFAVWTDGRSGSEEVVGTRITSTGRILDPLGLRIAPSFEHAIAPQVVWDGTAWLVVWTRVAGHGINGWMLENLYAARIAPNGGVVMMPRIIAEDAIVGEGRSMASNGMVSVIAYTSDQGPDRSARIAVLDRDGNTLHHETVDSIDEPWNGLTVAAGTSRFVVAWSTNPGTQPEDHVIRAVALTAAGHVIDPPAIVGRGDRPAIASDGTRFTIVSRRTEDWWEYTLLSRTFDANLDPIRDEQAIFDGIRIDHTSVLWVGGNHYEVFTVRQAPEDNEVVSIAIDPEGTANQPHVRGRIPVDSTWSQLVAATNGVDVLAAHLTDSPSADGTQVVARLYPANTNESGVPKLLSWSGNAHRDPHIAASAFGHIVAWTEDEGVFATRVDRNGHSIDGRGLRLSTYAGHARTAFDGTHYVVAWIDSGFIGVRTIAPLTGETIAEAQIPAAANELAVETSGDATFIVFSDDRVRVTRFPHTTYTPDPVPLAVSPAGMDVTQPVAAWNGSTLLISWNELGTGLRNPPIVVSFRIYGARVTGGLSLLDPAPILIASADEHGSFGGSAVASNGDDWLVVASHERRDVIARRVSRNGAVESDALIRIAEGNEPVVTWDGTRYAVAWKEGDPWQLERPLVLAAVQAAGALTATHRVFVSSATAASTPSIAAAGDGGTAIAYTRVSFLPEHAGVERSFFRVMDLGAQRGRVVRR